MNRVHVDDPTVQTTYNYVENKLYPTGDVRDEIDDTPDLGFITVALAWVSALAMLAFGALLWVSL